MPRFTRQNRLLKKADFQFSQEARFVLPEFIFLINPKGKGRVGISISKKSLKGAVGRNRVRRLIKEAFRKQKDRFSKKDLHVVGRPLLTKEWQQMKEQQVEGYLKRISEKIS